VLLHYKIARALSKRSNMNINGRYITAADLIEQIDMLHSRWSNLMYAYITDGVFLENMPSTYYKQRQLIEELIEYFVSVEDYEKCASLVHLKKRLRNNINKNKLKI
jgi:hypothetical protein